MRKIRRPLRFSSGFEQQTAKEVHKKQRSYNFPCKGVYEYLKITQLTQNFAKNKPVEYEK